MGEFNARAATPSDRAAIETLLAATYPRLLAGAYTPEVLEAAMPYMIRAQDSLLQSGTYFVALDDSQPVAAGGWTPEAPGTGIVARGIGHIRHVVVAHDRAGQGLGRRLMDHIAEDAIAGGIETMECLATLNAVAFYQAMGFEVLEDLTVTFPDGARLPSVRMQNRVREN
jgi:GNAT superfamily N-acetyltransferase